MKTLFTVITTVVTRAKTCKMAENIANNGIN
jgi:hypothetical protein